MPVHHRHLDVGRAGGRSARLRAAACRALRRRRRPPPRRGRPRSSARVTSCADRLFVLGDQDARHEPPQRRPATASRRVKKRTCTSWPSAGGEASRLRNGRSRRAPAPAATASRSRNRPRRRRRCAAQSAAAAPRPPSRRRAHDDALDHQHRHAVMSLVADLQIGEGEAAQVHRQPDRGIERGHLRHVPHDVLAPASSSAAHRTANSANDDRQRQPRHGAALAAPAAARAGGRRRSRCRAAPLSIGGVGRSRSGASGGASVDRDGNIRERDGRGGSFVAAVGCRRCVGRRRRRSSVRRAVACPAGCSAAAVDSGARHRRPRPPPAAPRPRAGGSVPSSARTAFAASSPAGCANQTVWQRTQRTERPSAPIAEAASW